MPAVNILFPTVDSAAAASSNTARIQSLLDAGGDCQLVGAGVVYTGKLKIGSNTRLRVDPRMTLRQAPGENSNLLVSKALLAPRTTVAVSWTAGPTASVAWAGHDLVVGDHLWLKGTAGTTDGAFCGVFRVTTVTDANNVVIVLRRTPEAPASGKITAAKADVNISVEGGVWDYSGSQNGRASAYGLFCIIMAGVAGLRLKDMAATATPKYCFCVGAVANYELDGLSVFATDSDGLKIYGPAFDGKVRTLSGISADDFLSIQAQEPAAYEVYNFTGWGDVLGLDVDGLDCQGSAPAYACSIYAPDTAAFLMDNIVLRNVSARNTNSPAIRVRPNADALARTRIHSLTIEQTEHRNALHALAVVHDVTVDLLTFRGIMARVPAAVECIVLQDADLRKVIVDGVNWYNGADGASFIYGSGTPRIEHIVVRNLHADGYSRSTGILLNFNCTGSIGLLEVESCNIQGVQKVFQLSPRHTSYPTISVSGCRIGTRVVGGMKAGSRLIVARNLIEDCDQGIARLEKAATAFELESLGGNKLTGSSEWLMKINGTESLTAKGWDIAVDVSDLARSSGQYCYNTNATLGTLAAAGLVVCQGTGSESWHLLANPTLAY